MPNTRSSTPTRFRIVNLGGHLPKQQPPPSDETARISADHVQMWRSTSDEVWGRPGICATSGHAWPCDTSIVLAALHATADHTREPNCDIHE